MRATIRSGVGVAAIGFALAACGQAPVQTAGDPLYLYDADTGRQEAVPGPATHPQFAAGGILPEPVEDY